jgi:hypothetical protein
MYARTLPPNNLNAAITRIKLGRALLRQNRLPEAEHEILGGYEILSKKENPSVTWLRSAREDLATIYAALNQPEKAKPFQTAQASAK